MAGVIQGVLDTGAVPAPAGQAQSILANRYGELETFDRTVGYSVPELLLKLINETRALRQVVCQATGQPYLDPDFQE